MEFEGAVKPFNELFEWSEFGRDFVEILKSDNLFKRDLVIGITLFVQEHESSNVRWVAIGYQGEFLVGICGADGFVHGDGGWQGIAVVGNMICADLMAL